jgi:hypothetical protein
LLLATRKVAADGFDSIIDAISTDLGTVTEMRIYVEKLRVALDYDSK